jgi:hypothetical protein
VPPSVAPTLEVEVTGVVVTATVDELLDEVVTDDTDDEPVAPVPADPEAALLDASGLVSSALLLSTGVSGGTLDGTLSLTVEPPHAASVTEPAAAPSNASAREARVIALSLRADPCDARRWGSR